MFLKIKMALFSMLAALAAGAAFVFSGDGVHAGSAPRELPSQAVRLGTEDVVVGLHALGDEARAACGWYRVVPSAPPAEPALQSNEVWRASGWAFSPTGTCSRTYTIAWRRIAPRTWTPLAIKRACGDRWPAVRAALQSADIYEDFMMAQELREDDAAFRQGYAWACAAYGTNVVDAVLEAAR